ncbi:MAG: hypothetical protein KAS12_06080 [Candidatus Aenigmarchaeota archaeon]|nr:hypothetical protein [Candidatus Aenigmarchaeota archaeon]
MIIDIILLILLIVSLLLLVGLVTKKFPLVASVDIEQNPKEKQAKIKQQLLEKKIKQNLIKQQRQIKTFFRPLKRYFLAIKQFIKKHLIKQSVNNLEEDQLTKKNDKEN